MNSIPPRHSVFVLLCVIAALARAQDTTPPSVPQIMGIDYETADSLYLWWNPSTDNVGTSGYEVFRNGVSAGTFSINAATLSGLSPSTVYSLTVRARDAAGNWSAQSQPVPAKTWQRLYSGSGTIESTSNYDEETQEWSYWTSTDYHYFTVSQAGTIRAFTRGVADTQGILDLGVAPGSLTVTGGPDGGNFFLTTSGYATGSRTLTVTGEEGQPGGAYQVFVDYRPPNSPPTASFTVSPSAGRAPLAVTFNGSASSDSGGSILSYAWDFDSNGQVDSAGSSATAATTYQNSGTGPLTYTATLRVYDQECASATTTRTVLVYPASSYAITVDGGTSSLPFQQAGSAVTLTANAPASGMQFNGWTVLSGNGTFADADSKITAFTVGSSDTVVKANYATDTNPPAPPTRLRANALTASTAELAWDAAFDQGTIALYEIFRDSVSLGTVTGTTATVTNLSPDTDYAFTVRAKDAVNLWSDPSGTLKIRTWQRLYAGSGTLVRVDEYDEYENYIGTYLTEDLHDYTVPGPGTVWIYVTGTTDTYLREVWAGESSTDLRFVAPSGPRYVVVGGETEWCEGSYELFVDFMPQVATFVASSEMGRAPLTVQFDASAAVDPFGAITSYAWDFDNNGTTDSSGKTASTTYAGSSSLATTYVSKLTVTGSSGTSSTTKSIAVYRSDSKAIAVQNGTSSLPFQFGGSTVTLTAVVPSGRTFSNWALVSGTGTLANANAQVTTFTVGNSDAVVRATFLGDADSSPPSVPSTLGTVAKTATTLTFIWRASADNVGVVGYEIFRDGATTPTGSTPETVFTDSGLSPNSTHTYTVKAYDAAGLRSAASAVLTDTTNPDPNLDSDGDGVPNASEAVLGTDPNSAGGSDTTNSTQLKVQRPVK
ncbi:MAG: fibronectin type III domain-containing protein [Verrucomicrobia bacterium]|nr:fibronectin type III domain-containing protein [Verrucomicrobiota bacterium]